MKHLLMFRITGKISGAEVYNKYLVSELKKYTDLHITVISNYKIFLKFFSSSSSVDTISVRTPVFEVGTKRNLLRFFLILPFYYIELLFLLARFAGKEEVIFCLQSMSEKLFFTSLLKALGYKIVWIEHGPLFGTERAAIIKYLYTKISTSVDAIIAVSHSTKKDLVIGGVPEAKIHVIYIGIDNDLWISKKSTLRGKKIIIGYVGSIDKAKGVYEFIKVMESLHMQNMNVQGLLVGRGFEYEAVTNLIKSKGYENVIHAAGEQSDAQEYFRKIDIFLFLTKGEGLSISLLEAVFSGCYVVCTDVGGNAEVVKSKGVGALIPIQDIENVEKISNIILKIIKKGVYKNNENERLTVYKSFNAETQALKFRDFFINLCLKK